MNKDEHKYFVAGLKAVIKREWATQEEFAEGITSKVNLSKVLNGSSGTSPTMREKMAAKAGMSIEDIVAIGKDAMRPKSMKVNIFGDPIPVGVPISSDDLLFMSSEDLLSTVYSYSSQLTEQILVHAKQVGDTAVVMTKERNRLFKILEKERNFSNSIDQAIKVVNKEYEIEFCNRAYSKRYKQVEGDHCSEDNCISCKGDCLAGKVFATGKPEHSLVKENGSWIYKTAYPVQSPTGIIDAVVVVSREIDTLMETLREKGWECKFKGTA